MTPKRTAARTVAPIALAGLLALATTACSSSSPAAPTTPPILPSLSEMLAEKTLGSASAPVTMIEYSSLGCYYCMEFQILTFPQIKTTYIDTGRVRFIYRDFPLDPEGEAPIAAAMVARCSGSNFFTTVDTLFRSQGSWAYSPNYVGAIKSVVSRIGITSDYVDACLATPGLRDGILAIRAAGIQQYGSLIDGTPTFFINGQRVRGAQPFPAFAAIIDSM
jgi:protein-disulfide isomerase